MTIPDTASATKLVKERRRDQRLNRLQVVIESRIRAANHTTSDPTSRDE